MSRLPTPGADYDIWGQILNDYLSVAHNPDGTLQGSALQEGGGVMSVNGKTPSGGAVSLGPGDIGAPTTLAGDSDVSLAGVAGGETLVYDGASGKWKNQVPPSAPVFSVAGKTGAVTLAEGDVANLSADLAGKLAAASNLSDLTNPAAARTNLGLSAAGGDLSGTLPNPTVAKVNGVAVSGTPAAGQALVATSGTAAGWSVVTGTSDWLNVKTLFGALGNGAADDTTAIQNALNACPVGGVVYLPAGTYVTTAPLLIPPAVTLLGSHGTHLDVITTSIKPSAGFSGASVIGMVDQATGGYAQASNEQRVQQLSINGANLPGGNTVDGIRFTGFVHGVYLLDININAVGGHGITAVGNGSGSSYSHRGSRIVVNASGSYGFSLSMTDCTWTDLEAIGCGDATHGGFFIGTFGNTHFTDCRSEWSGLNGYDIGGSTGTGTGSGGATFTNCTTDRNTGNGFNITSAGNAPLIFNGCVARRDGRNGGAGGSGYAGFNVSGAVCPVVVNGLTVYPGVDDNGTATNSPQVGVSVTNARYVSLNSGWVHAASTAIRDGGGNTTFRISPNIGTATGTTAAPTFNLTNPWATDSGSTFTANLDGDDQVGIAVTQASGFTNVNSPIMSLQTGNNGNDYLIKAKVAGDTNSRFGLNVSGQLNWGPGNAAADTDLYRNGVGALKTDGTMQIVTSLGVGQTPPTSGIGTKLTAADATGLSIQNTAANANNPLLSLQVGTAGTDNAVKISVAGEAHTRFIQTAAGVMSWGAGSALVDTGLYRAGAGQLRTDTDFLGQTVTATGFTGVTTAASRYVGGTVSGAPASGPFLTGDFVIDQTGTIWICTASGSPGTWVDGQTGDFNALSPMTTIGDIEYESAANTASRLPGNATTVPMQLTSTGSGSAALSPAWQRRADWLPSDHGMITWSFDPAAINATTIIPTAGQVNLIKLHVPGIATITNLLLSISVAGSGLTGGQNFAALYNGSGTLLSATADQSAVWNSTGVKVMPLSAPQAVSAGDYYLAFYANGTTLPTLRSGGSAGSMANANLGLANSRFATADTGKTTAMPGTLAPIAALAVSWFGAFS